jgi:hypothetical protein
MSLDNFIIVDPHTNKWFAASDAYLVDQRKLSDEEYDALFECPSPKTEKMFQQHGMSIEACEYHKIMEDAEQEEKPTPINLEEFVGKEVVITQNNGVVFETTLYRNRDVERPYYFNVPGWSYMYNKDGVYNPKCPEYKFNIKEIKLKQSQKAMTPLSDATIKKLGDALTDDAIKYLETDEEVIETLVSVISRFLIDRMGQMDDTLLNELSFIIFDNFDIVSNNK